MFNHPAGNSLRFHQDGQTSSILGNSGRGGLGRWLFLRENPVFSLDPFQRGSDWNPVGKLEGSEVSSFDQEALFNIAPSSFPFLLLSSPLLPGSALVSCPTERSARLFACIMTAHNHIPYAPTPSEAVRLPV